LRDVIQKLSNFGYAGAAEAFIPERSLRSIVIYRTHFDTSKIEFSGEAF
jgi:hypothetical protein